MLTWQGVIVILLTEHLHKRCSVYMVKYRFYRIENTSHSSGGSCTPCHLPTDTRIDWEGNKTFV